MSNITKEYLILFNAISDLADQLEETRRRLILAQQAAEESYISGED